MYTVYMHVFPNGKRYIGVTRVKPELRWGVNGGNYKNPYMKNAIKKYGWNNIEHIIVAENLTFEQANNMEISLIEKYNSANKDYGYNLSLGGIQRKIVSESTKEKLRKCNLGKIMSDEAKKKISEFQKGQVKSEKIRKNMSNAQKKNFMNGNNAMHSPEARKKASAKLKGRIVSKYQIEKANEGRRHPVINIETGIKYGSIKEASEKNGVYSSTIIRHCNGKCQNKKWKYA